MNVYIYTHTYTHTHTHTFIHMYTGSADRLAGVARLLPLRQRARGSTGCECEGGSGCWRRNKTKYGATMRVDDACVKTVCVCVYKYERNRERERESMHTCMHVCMHVRTHVRTYVCMHACMHAHTHAHTRIRQEMEGEARRAPGPCGTLVPTSPLALPTHMRTSPFRVRCRVCLCM